ncbi:MAG: GNAT family N-acetyltransferase [Nitrospira sp.]|nr:GNAT family N-acetyltransferase [Nitrospira sp.]
MHRFEAHSALEQYASSLEDIQNFLTDDPQGEVACFVVLKCDWFSASEIIGISHFRRSWSNSIILDYLTIHPLILSPPNEDVRKVKGIGSALLYFLSSVAKRFECDAIWGEATSSSCSFYKRVLKLDSVKDLIYAPRSNFLQFMEVMKKSWEQPDSTTVIARDEIYRAETENPPLTGSKTAVFSPARRLAYRFLELPYHLQYQVSHTLGLRTEEDSGKPLVEQFALIFQRARAAGKLAELWQLVEANHSDGEIGNNPFQVP